MEVRPGYKQTEAGVIPADWEVTALGTCLSRRPDYGINAPAVTYSDRLPTYLRITDISEDGRYLPAPPVSVDSPQAADYILAEGDIVFARTGASVGKSYRYKLSDGPLVFAGFLIRVRPDPRLLLPAFAAAYATTRTYWNWVRATSMRSGQPGINGAEYARLPIPRPHVDEQRAVAAALNDVDALLDGLDRLIAKKRDLKQAVIQQLLTGQTRLPGFGGEWEEAQVQDVIASFFCGPSPTCEERNIQDEDEWGVLKTTAATKENGWDWTKHKTLPRAFWNKPQIELKKGDVIVTKAGPRHRVGVTAWVNYVPPRIIPSGKMIALRPRRDKVVPLMLAAAISARDAQTYLDQRTTGMAESQVNFENTVLLEAPIRIPRVEEQTAIATVLTEMDAELAALEARRDKIRHLKQAMMQALLTGKTRLLPAGSAHA